MRVVIDIECNALRNPTKIWVIVCKDIDTGEIHVFREKDAFRSFADNVSLWIGHNFIGYDYPTLHTLDYLPDVDISTRVVDTLIISKLVDYPRDGHSIEDYGVEFGYPKGKHSDWSAYSKDMEDYCVRDVEICHKIYDKYHRVIRDPKWSDAIQLEQRFQIVCTQLHDNGFCFNVAGATKLLEKVGEELGKLDKEILEAFPPKEEFIRKIRKNKDGSINRVDARYIESPDPNIIVRDVAEDIHLYRRKEFNPASHKQLIEVLSEAGWKPTDRTQTHINWLRERKKAVDKEKKDHYNKYGWKINENNLLSLPVSAPRAAKLLARRILYESRRRTLVEWISLMGDDGRIHGDFQGIGAWTHRMAHQRPNTANIPNEFDEQGRIKLLGGDLRQLWGAPKNRLLIGCDAEGIQLRIFAHYIDDPEFTREVSEGDPHSLNQKVLGSVCRTRQASKRFIYALLLGAGLGKLGEILEAGAEDTKGALDRILRRYTGFAHLKENVFPRDIRRGWFQGLDGRKVTIPKVDERPHLVMSGYLQNGEAIIMKRATLEWMKTLDGLPDGYRNGTWSPSGNGDLHNSGFPYLLVDLVHDEWQTECPNNMDIAKAIGQAQCDALTKIGMDLGLKCPLTGTFYNKKKQDYTIGTNWRVTH